MRETNKEQTCPAVSVLIPIYNVEKYLDECLDSVVNQTLKDIEIICLNDGSTDKSLDIVKKYAKDDDRVVIVNKKNSGYGDSMNKGLSVAKGKYIGIVESDDFIELNAFERLFELGEKFNADVVRSNFYEYKEGKDTLYPSVNPQDAYRLVNPRQRISIFYQKPAIWSAIYRRDFLDKHNIKFLPTPGASYQDTSFSFKVWSTTRKAVFTEEAFLHYRQDNEASSVNNPGKVFNVAIEYEEIEKYLRKKNLYDSMKEIMQMAKFGAYYWNIYRLAPELRHDFVEKAKEEFTEAQNEGSLSKAFFPGNEQWALLTYMLNHDVEQTLKYVKRTKRKNELKRKIRTKLKKAYIKINPYYRKEREQAKLISKIIYENNILKQRLAERNNEEQKEAGN